MDDVKSTTIVPQQSTLFSRVSRLYASIIAVSALPWWERACIVILPAFVYVSWSFFYAYHSWSFIAYSRLPLQVISTIASEELTFALIIIPAVLVLLVSRSHRAMTYLFVGLSVIGIITLCLFLVFGRGIMLSLLGLFAGVAPSPGIPTLVFMSTIIGAAIIKLAIFPSVIFVLLRVIRLAFGIIIYPLLFLFAVVLPFFALPELNAIQSCSDAERPGFSQKNAQGLCIIEQGLKMRDPKVCRSLDWHIYSDYKKGDSHFCDYVFSQSVSDVETDVGKLLDEFLGVKGFNDNDYHYNSSSGIITKKLPAMSVAEYVSWLEREDPKDEYADGRYDLSDSKDRMYLCRDLVKSPDDTELCITTFRKAGFHLRYGLCDIFLDKGESTSSRKRYAQCGLASFPRVIRWQASSVDEYVDNILNKELGGSYVHGNSTISASQIDDWVDGCTYIAEGAITREQYVECVIAIAGVFHNSDACTFGYSEFTSEDELECGIRATLGPNKQ